MKREEAEEIWLMRSFITCTLRQIRHNYNDKVNENEMDRAYIIHEHQEFETFKCFKKASCI
jgi:hypothetical protein